jgi:peptidoglycan/xylan/chitin deacetylase (PgdA/CDA1 family)
MTDAYLEALDRLDAPATFFVTGDRLAADRRVVTRYLRGGHQLAAHGWDHTPFPRLTTAELRVQLRRTDAVLGPQPTARPWVRPPHGALTPKVALQLVASGYTVALWSVDPRDYAGPTPETLAQRCSPGRLSGGDVVLLHEGERSTLAALPAIVGRLRDAGFELVTMADLVAR